MSDVIKQTGGGNSTPAIATSAGTALAANEKRIGWIIQNLDTDPLFVKFGASASATVFNMVLKGGTGADDGTGGSYEQMSGLIWTGIITVAGTTPRFVATEICP